MLKRLWVITFLILVSTVPMRAQSQDVRQLLEEADVLIDRGEFPEAQAVLREAMMTVSNIAPLEIYFFDLVSSPAENFSNFKLRKDNIFKPDEPILLYVEPVGYAFRRKGDIFEFGVEADFLLLDEAGNILGGKERFYRSLLQGYAPVFDFHMSLTYNFTGLTPGKYAVRTTLTDVVDGEQAWFEMPFEIRN